MAERTISVEQRIKDFTKGHVAVALSDAKRDANMNNNSSNIKPSDHDNEIDDIIKLEGVTNNSNIPCSTTNNITYNFQRHYKITKSWPC